MPQPEEMQTSELLSVDTGMVITSTDLEGAGMANPGAAWPTGDASSATSGSSTAARNVVGWVGYCKELHEQEDLQFRPWYSQQFNHDYDAQEAANMHAYTYGHAAFVSTVWA